MRHDFGYVEEDRLGKPYDVRLLRRLYPFVQPYRLLLVLAIVLVVAITLLELSLPYITKVAIDRYIVPKNVMPQTAPAGDESGRVRYLTLDLADAELRRLVDRRSPLFDVDGQQARIALDDYARLDRREMALIRRGDLSGLGLAAAVFVLFICSNFILNFLQVMIMEYAGQNIMHDLRQRLYEHVQGLQVAFFSRNPLGRLVTRVTNDVQNMNELFTSVIVVIFKDLFLLVGIMLVLLAVQWRLALVSFTVLPLVVWASLHFSALARDVFRVLRVKIAEINTRFAESIGGMTVIQLFGREADNYQRFEKLNHENYRAGMQQVQVFAVFMPVIEVLGAAAIALVIFYGGRGVLHESISLGALVAFISYMRMFFRPIRDIAEKYNVMQNAMASAERIFVLLDSPEQDAQEVSVAPMPGVGSGRRELERIETIDVADVRFAYVEGQPVLRGVSFGLRSGETLAVVGPTGSGKTTLINLLIRFYDPTQGSIRINGVDTRRFDKELLRSRMALVMQDPFLFSSTIRSNIFANGADVAPGDVDRILELARCRDLVDRLPDGLDTVLGEGGGSLSSGERQLVSIARAFAADPQLIILDEATSYIDSATEQKIQEALHNLVRERTALVVAHRLSTARTSDRILVLNRGEVVEAGSHDALMARQGFYYHLYGLQG